MRAKFGLVSTAVSKILSFKFISRFVNTTTGALAKLKVEEDPISRSAKVSGRKQILKNFDYSSCRGDDVTRRATGVRVFGLNLIINNVALFMHNNVCRACLAALGYYTTVYKSL